MTGVGDVIGAGASIAELVKLAQEHGHKVFPEYHHFWRAFEKQVKNDRNVPWAQISANCHLQPEFIGLATAVIRGDADSRARIEEYFRKFVKPPDSAYEDLETILRKLFDAVDVAASRAIKNDPAAALLAQRRHVEDTVREVGERTSGAVERSRDVLLERLGRIEHGEVVDDVAMTRHWATEVVVQHDGLYHDEWLHVGPVPSPLERHWDALVSGTQWHEVVRVDLSRLCELTDTLRERDDGALAKLAERCDSIDCRGEYRVIAGALAGLERLKAPIAEEVSRQRAALVRGERSSGDATIREIELDFQRLQDLLDELASRGRRPSFGRCLLVAGSAGEGKTHFIAELMRDAAAEPEAMVLLVLQAAPSPGRLGAALRDEAERATGHRWEHWEDLARHLAERGRRLVVAVDDVDRWPESGLDLVAELEDAIARSTRHPSVYWLLTAEISGLERLVGNRSAWRRYSLAPEAGWRPERSAQRVDGWLLLDDLNRDAQTGIGVLESARPMSAPPVIAQLAAAEEPEVAAVLSQLVTPFTAWAVDESAGERDLQYDALLDLSYGSIVESFWDRLLERFRISRDCDRSQFRSVMALAAEVVAEERTDTLRLGRLRSCIVTRGIARDAAVVEPRVADSGLRHAMTLGLLTLLPAAAEAEADSVVRLRFELVWEWLIAGFLFNDAGMSDRGDVDVTRLLGRIAELAPDRILENVAQLCLVRIDKAQGPAAGHREGSVWDAALRSERVPDAAVWFAGPKASSRTQTVLVMRARDARTRNTVRRSTFATLWFLAEAGSRMSRPSRAFEPVADRYESIRAQDLGGVLEFVVARLLGAVPDRRELELCLAQLLGSEVANADTMALAEMAVGAIDRLRLTPPQAILASRGLLRKVKPGSSTGPLQTFHDCYIQVFLRRLVDRCGVPTYGLLRDPDCKWYDAALAHVHGDVAHRMRTEANAAFGRWYRKNRNGRPGYVALVATLTHAEERRDRENAVYLMRHTRPIFKGGSERVDSDFRPYIRVLRDDPDLRDVVRKCRRFFEENLDDDAGTAP